MLLNIFLYFFLFILGASLGSFINVIVSRTAKEEKIVSTKSHSDCCGVLLKPWELIPIFSYLWQRGKCRSCRHRISSEHLVVETVVGLLFIIGLWQIAQPFYLASYQDWLYLLYYLAVVVFLVMIFLYDAKYQYILDQFSYPLIGLGVLNVIIFSDQWQLSLMAGLIGGAWFYGQYLLSRGQWVGAGDIFLGVAMGLLLGWPWIILALILSYILGTIVAVYLLITKQVKLQSKLAFGPFLVIGTWLVLLWGEQIWQQYLQLFF